MSSTQTTMKEKEDVIWPRGVATKIWKRWDSCNFVTDFPPSPESSLEITTSQDEFHSPKRVFKDRKNTRNYKVFASTWNVGGVVPPENLDMEELLDTQNNPCDIYVLGFQEIVPLNAGNVLGIEKNKISIEWNSLIREALNKYTNSFRCIVRKNMVGILISVWVRINLQQYVQHASVSCVRCGIMGYLGNKGSVSVRFCLHGTRFCFVCVHLASGGKQGDEKRRNSDAQEILSRTSFPSDQTNSLPRKIQDHDRIIFLGDFNYRISLPEDKTRTLAENEEWDLLLEKDQLSVELMEGKVFEGWQEGTVQFAPTYKYYPNSDRYYGCVHQPKKGEKKRAPAWCDRILWFGNGLRQKEYSRVENMLSDHRPVRAIFDAEVDIKKRSREFRSFFSSERLEQIPNSLELFPADDFVYNGRSSFSL